MEYFLVVFTFSQRELLIFANVENHFFEYLNLDLNLE